MFDRYTEPARRAVFFGRYEASLSGSDHIETEHLLLGILRDDPQLAQRLLHSPAKVEAIREQIGRRSPARKPGATSVDLPLSKECKRVLEYAAKGAEELNQKAINPAHLLLGIAREESCLAARILRENGITPAQLRDEAIRQAGQSAAPGIAAAAGESPPAAGGLRDLTEEARQGKLGLLIGRDRELDRIIHILSRRTKNNPVLIGEAGIGKTAIVEGLARRMAEGEAPLTFTERRLLAVDASALTAPRRPARPPGQLEGALADALAAPGEVVLFVRGLFNLAAAGSAWAVVEAMHALEPHLAHGGIQCIATGSPAGLRETIEKAGMLARHFEVVTVAPLNEEDTIRIVSGLKAQFEQFHEVTFGEGAVETAVYASGIFLPDRHLPDRAIDLIDEAAAAVKLRRENEPREITEVRKRIRQYSRGSENAIAAHRFDEARRYEDEERRERENLQRLREQYKTAETPSTAVMPADIEAAAAARAGVPVEAVRRALQEKEPAKVQQIAGELAAQVPVEHREWIPYLAAYLLRCSAAEAEALAQAITAAKAKAAGPKSREAGGGENNPSAGR